MLDVTNDNGSTFGYCFPIYPLCYATKGVGECTYNRQYLLAHFQERLGQDFPLLGLHMLHSFQSRSEDCSLHLYALLHKSAQVILKRGKESIGFWFQNQGERRKAQSFKRARREPWLK